MSNDGSERLLTFVGLQAAKRMPLLSTQDRELLLKGLQLVLPAAELEQCALIHAALSSSEMAANQANDAQMVLEDLLSQL